MNLLAIETSGATCGAALFSGDSPATLRLLALCETTQANVHDARLAELVRSVLAETGLTPVDVTTLALSSGPGSFTGLRIGASFSKGFCFARSVDFLAVNTMESLVHAARLSVDLSIVEHVVCAIPSHRNLAYTAVFNAEGTCLSAIQLIPVEEISHGLSSTDIVVVPDGFSPPISQATLFRTPFSARFVGLRAIDLICKGASFDDAEHFVPDYRQEFVPVAPSR